MLALIRTHGEIFFFFLENREGKKCKKMIRNDRENASSKIYWWLRTADVILRKLCSYHRTRTINDFRLECTNSNRRTE